MPCPEEDSDRGPASAVSEVDAFALKHVIEHMKLESLPVLSKLDAGTSKYLRFVCAEFFVRHMPVP